MLAVVTGPVRSGKSRAALRLALDTDREVVVAVGGREDDPEMVRRIAAHRAERPGSVSVVEADGELAWLAGVPDKTCLVVDCLGTILGLSLVGLVPEGAQIAGHEAETAAVRIVDALVEALAERGGPTIVVSNEVGWGVVPATPLGRLFRDAVGRANRALVARSEAAWLVVSGRAIDLHAYSEEIAWPTR
jgi:adenosylcobinamide kinase/adenosylcobinamide-phosphate guanylyltransferase